MNNNKLEEKFFTKIPNRSIFLKLMKNNNETYRKVSPSRYFYKKIIEKHNKIKNMSKLLKDKEFIELIYCALDSWNMNQRGSKLVQYPIFAKSIESQASILDNLYKVRLENILVNEKEQIFDYLKTLFTKLNITTWKTKIVWISKTLHFLLPNLVPPIDRTFTMDFLYWHINYKTWKNEVKNFIEIINWFEIIANKLKLTKADIDFEWWNTSIPKLIDNAIIWYVKIQ